MRPITKYLCDICEREHSTEKLALTCEAKGYPKETEHIKEGDEITFWCQHRPIEQSSLETYTEEKGKVLYKFTAFNDKQNNHVDIIVCEVEEDGVKIERQMMLMYFENEGKKLFSPSSMKYKLGWAAGLRAMRNQ